MTRRITTADITQALYDAYEETFDEAPPRFDRGVKIYSDLHVNKGIGKLVALQWFYVAVNELGINERPFMTTRKPSESKDYTIGEVTDMLAEQAERQGILQAA